MRLYRVVISYMKDQLQFMAERGVLAMSPGQALDDVLSHLQVDQTRISSLKCFTTKPQELDEFTMDAQFLHCIGTNRSVQDIWTKRYGDKL